MSSIKQGWVEKKLGDVCGIVNGGTPKTSISEYWNGDNLWITPKDMGKLNSIYVEDTSRKITDEGIKNSSAKLFSAYSIILSSRAPIGHLAINKKPISTNQGCKGIIPSDAINYLYLYFFLKKSVKLLNSLGSGTTFKELSSGKLKNVIIPVPPLEEQKQIVAKLDQAFAVIDKAKANATKNLENAKQLFQSKLNEIFSQKGKGWVEKKLGDVVNIKTGKLNSNAMVEGGKHPFFTCSREVFAINEYAFDCEAVLLAGNNASGDFNVKHYKGKFNAYQRTYVITVNESSEITYPFLQYKLVNHLKNFKRQSIGAGTKFLKIGMIKGLDVTLPAVSEQNTITTILDSLSFETKSLEFKYQKELESLEGLKKSILQKAFNGGMSGKQIET